MKTQQWALPFCVSLTSWSGTACVAEVYGTSWASLLLLFIGKERTNMAVPREAQIRSKNKAKEEKRKKEGKSFCCIHIDRTSYKACRWKYFTKVFCCWASLRLGLWIPWQRPCEAGTRAVTKGSIHHYSADQVSTLHAGGLRAASPTRWHTFSVAGEWKGREHRHWNACT